jgi:hypothetical protein
MFSALLLGVIFSTLARLCFAHPAEENLSSRAIRRWRGLQSDFSGNFSASAGDAFREEALHFINVLPLHPSS